MVNEYGYEYDTVLDEELYKKTRGEVTYGKFKGAMCFRSGRDALKAVAREFESTDVLVPALACNSMILPFVMYNHNIKYYKLNKDYSINLKSLYSLISKKAKWVLFLYMDYFGNKAINDIELEKLKAEYPSLIFIEDRTHNFLVRSSYTFIPEFTIASLRKWIDIPDGGLLWTNRELKFRDYCKDLSFFEMRLQAQCMRNKFLQCGDEEIKKRYREIFSMVTDKIDEEKLPGLMSLYSYKRACKTNLEEVNNIHCRNAQILIDKLYDFDFVQNESGLGDIYVAVLIKNRDIVQRKLASMGIFCTIIWPLNDEQRVICDVARDTEEHILAIYCDQRYSVEDMQYIASSVRRVCNE
nr:hypothetical protein [uncultured Blautia sp.]